MLRYSAFSVVAGVLSLAAVAGSSAVAAQGVQIPAGDVLQATPPIDWTPFDVETASPRDRRAATRLQEGRSVAIDDQFRLFPDLTR